MPWQWAAARRTSRKGLSVLGRSQPPGWGVLPYRDPFSCHRGFSQGSSCLPSFILCESCLANFFFKNFFFMWTSFKGFIEFVTILLLFYVFGFFGHEACRILTPWPGLQPAPPALEGEVLPTDLQGGPLLGKLRLVFRMWHISTMLLLQHMTPNFCIWLLDYSWAMWNHCVETCSLLWEGAARLGLQTLEQSWVTPSLPWPGGCSDNLPASIAQWLWWGGEGAESWTKF